MPAKGPGFGSSGRVGGGSRNAAMRGSAPRPAPKPKSTRYYHGTTWKYKTGDAVKSSSATTSYRIAKKYSSSNRAVSREEFAAKVSKREPNKKAYGKPTVYKVKSTTGNVKTSQRSYRTSKSEVNSSWKVTGKAKAPRATMRAAAKMGTEGPKKSMPKRKK